MLCVMKVFTLPFIIPGHLPHKLTKTLCQNGEESFHYVSLYKRCIPPQPGPGPARCREQEVSGQAVARPPHPRVSSNRGQRRKLVKTETGSNIITVQHSSQKARSFKHSLHTAAHCSLCSHNVAVVAADPR